MQFDLIKTEELTVSFDLTINPQDVDLSERSVRLTSPASFVGKVKKSDWVSLVTGSADAGIERNCDRCLGRVEVQHSFKVENSYVYFERLSDELESELETLGKDYSVTGNPELDLTQVFGEQLLISLPDRFLCEEDCRGLCPDCGQKVESDKCDCGAEEIDPRWSALKNIKVR